MPAQTRKPTTKPSTSKGSTVTTPTRTAPAKPVAKPAPAAETKRTRNPLPALTIDAAALAASAVESDVPLRQNRNGKNSEHVTALMGLLERSWAGKDEKGHGKAITIPVPESQSKTVVALLRRAADALDIGVRTNVDGDRVTFAAWQKKAYKPRAAKA